MPTTEDYVRSLAKCKPQEDRATTAELLDKLFSERGDSGSAEKRYKSAKKLYAPTIKKAQDSGSVRAASVIRAESVAEKVAEEAAEDPSKWERACELLEEAHGLACRILDGIRRQFESTRKQSLDMLKEAMALTEIGGGAVATKLGLADKLAKVQQWASALETLNSAVGSAELVNERAPYIKARREHGDKLKAAMGITFKEYGKVIKTRWEDAESKAKQGNYSDAASKIIALADYLKNTVEADGELTQRKSEVEQARNQNVTNMKTAISGENVDLEQLKQLVKLELVGDPPTEALSKQAAQVGDDPGAKSRQPIVDPGKAEELFKKHDWFALKDMLHAEQITTDTMWDLWRFRQKYVTELIDTLRGKYPTLLAKASGSTDLESDIDITFASGASGDDVRAAQAFNATIKNKFGKPPGRVFDVNIYPRDYSAISESFNQDYNLEPVKDRDIDQPTSDMQLLSQVDQDVATLLKQRRFLDEEAFNSLLQDVLDKAPDEETRKKIEKQYEEGEDIYLLTALEKVDKIATTLQLNNIEYPKELNELYELRKGGGQEDMIKLQKLLPKVLDLLERDFPAEVMQTTDDLYLEKMAELRDDQDRIALLSDFTVSPDAHHPELPCDSVHEGVEHRDWLDHEAEALKAKVKKDQFTNIIFANEAYMSQGAIEHVVAGIQAKDPQKKEEALAKLTPATLMQSCNEQLADFFKDMKHYETEIGEVSDPVKQRRETGEAFVHASKYLVRLLDAADILVQKYEKSETPLSFEFIENIRKKHPAITSPGKLKGRVEEMLYALRKSSTIPAEVKGEVGVAEVEDLFGVKDIVAFRKLITELGTEINQKVRSRTDFIESQTVDLETERQFFGVPPAPSEFNGIIAYAEGEIEDIADLLEKPIPDENNPKGRQVLLDQLEDCMGRATTARNDLAKYDTRKLHESHRNDAKKVLEDLGREMEKLANVIEELK